MASIEDQFTSGLPASHDYPVMAPPPGQPGFGENYAFWIHDESTGVQINAHLNTSEDIGAYDQRVNKLSVIFPDGRTYLLRESGACSDIAVVASASLRFRCLEPFRRWSCEFDGVMLDATIHRTYVSGAALDHPRVPVSFRIETEMVAPAWIQGAFAEGGLGPVTSFVGGRRYEQLFRNVGELRVGDEVMRIEGYGNRTHRMGARNVTATPNTPQMLGHVWVAAAFPSGTGFGFQIYPTADGDVLWAEGFVLRAGELIPAEVVRAPWLCTYLAAREPLHIVLRAGGETFEVAGETLATSVGIMIPAPRPGGQIPLFQSCARFNLRGETAVNMIERSLRRSCIETSIGRPQ